MYQKFVKEVKELLQEQLGDGYELTIHNVRKLNDTQLCGIGVRNKSANIGPIIYLEEYYQHHLNGMSIEEIIGRILNTYEEVKCENSVSTEFLQWNNVKPKIVMKLINLKENEEYLKNIVYVPFHDLAIVFCVLVEMDSHGCASCVIKNEFLNVWNVTKEEIYEIAKENTPKLLPYNMIPLSSIVDEFDCFNEFLELMKFMEIEKEIFILTNKFHTFGTSSILYEDMLETIIKEVGKDFFLIPSSIHEWIIIPNSLYEKEIIDEIIKEVNDTLLKDDEILGNHCYYYDSETKELKF